jgi:phosphatidylglycerol:prolipoprotein diacylglycerol transferase
MNSEGNLMHPVIISLGPLVIRSYGLFLALGFLCGTFLAVWRAKKAGDNPETIYNLSVLVVISALIGARLYYVVTHYSEFRAEENLPWLNRFFVEFKNMFWPIGSDGQIGISGLVLYGGLICATVATVFYLRIHKLSIPRYMDYLAPSIGLGEFFTRIGCFMNGCCFGKPTDSVFGVVFPSDSAAGMFFPGIQIHPSQLYNSFTGLVICIALLILERYKRFDGFTALLFFILYSIGRFFTDYTRIYENQLIFFGLSHNQLVSLAVFIIATSLMVYYLVARSSKTGKL